MSTEIINNCGCCGGVCCVNSYLLYKNTQKPLSSIDPTGYIYAANYIGGNLQNFTGSNPNEYIKYSKNYSCYYGTYQTVSLSDFPRKIDCTKSYCNNKWVLTVIEGASIYYSNAFRTIDSGDIDNNGNLQNFPDSTYVYCRYGATIVLWCVEDCPDDWILVLKESAPLPLSGYSFTSFFYSGNWGNLDQSRNVLNEKIDTSALGYYNYSNSLLSYTEEEEGLRNKRSNVFKVINRNTGEDFIGIPETIKELYNDPEFFVAELEIIYKANFTYGKSINGFTSVLNFEMELPTSDVSYCLYIRFDKNLPALVYVTGIDNPFLEMLYTSVNPISLYNIIGDPSSILPLSIIPRQITDCVIRYRGKQKGVFTFNTEQNDTYTHIPQYNGEPINIPSRRYDFMVTNYYPT